jgi:hypothetical protein
MTIYRENLMRKGKAYFDQLPFICESQTVCEIRFFFETNPLKQHALKASLLKPLSFIGINSPGSQVCCRLRESPSTEEICRQAEHAEVMAVRRARTFLERNFERTHLDNPRVQAFVTLQVSRTPCNECWEEINSFIDFMRGKFANPPKWMLTLL